jgi:hypothetical protein
VKKSLDSSSSCASWNRTSSMPLLGPWVTFSWLVFHCASSYMSNLLISISLAGGCSRLCTSPYVGFSLWPAAYGSWSPLRVARMCEHEFQDFPVILSSLSCAPVLAASAHYLLRKPGLTQSENSE